MNPSLKAWMRALELSAPIERQGHALPQVIDGLAARLGEAPALVARDAGLSYRELAEAAHRYARWGLARGLAAGDVVGLLMPNDPHYMAIWLGLNRIGVTVALLNTHLTGERLAHCIRIVEPRAIIAGAALCEAVRSAQPHVPAALEIWAFGAEKSSVSQAGRAPGGAGFPPSDSTRQGFPRLDLEICGVSALPITDVERAPPALESRALFIYTSGTTGLPKAAAVSHLRVMQWSHWFAGMMDTRPEDRMYACLPMYHSIGGIVATGAPLVGGGTVILRERFSAGEFWQDVVAERCTLFQYIGELCRYLLNSAPHPDESRHQLRLCCGNGLRAEVWEPFQSRFRIPRILEYYAATEGSFSLYNCEGQPGAIGRIPPFLSHRLPVALVRYDMTTGAPARNEAGRCLPCGPNEAGEAIGQLTDAAGKPHGRFEGYADAEASSRKVLRDVFAAGDAWYRTGDLMRQDEQGFFYFVDRIGDTFRWKGENVSASEVEAVMSACPGVVESAVYGVTLPGTDGRAGMAAIVADRALDLGALRTHVAAHLPDYARPLFVRLVPALDLTGTYKLDKQALTRQGWDPAATSDEIYFDDRRRQRYVRLDTPLSERIRAGDERL